MSKQQTKIKTLEQGRADEAFQAVKTIKDKSFAEKYKSYSKSLPMMIKTNGLGASMAFIAAKKGRIGSDEKKSYYSLYKHIQDRLINTDWLTSDRDMVEYIISIDSFEYRAITIEVLSYLSWLRRFTEGQIKKQTTDSNTQTTNKNA